jgi:cell division protein FtsB
MSATVTRTLRRKMRFTPRAMILAAVMFGLLLYTFVPLRSYMGQNGRLVRLEQQAQVLERENAKLQAQIRQLEDPVYIERIARECLGMIRPGEVAFVVVPKQGRLTPPDDC